MNFTKIILTRCQILFSFKIHQIQFRLGLSPWPHYELYLGKGRQRVRDERGEEGEGGRGREEGKCVVGTSTYFRVWGRMGRRQGRKGEEEG